MLLPWHATHTPTRAQPRGPTPLYHVLATLCSLDVVVSLPCGHAWLCRMLSYHVWEGRLLYHHFSVNATLLLPRASAIHCGVVPCRHRLAGCDSAAKRLVHVLLFTIACARLRFEITATSAATAVGQPCLTSLFLCRRAVPRQAHRVSQIHEITCACGWSRDLGTRRTLPLLLPAGVEPQFEVASPSITLRLHGSARLIPLGPSTSVQFIGTVPSP